MKTVLNISLITIISIGLIWGLAYAAFQSKTEITNLKPKPNLTQEQAIKLAEQFVINNGYTSFPADKSKLRNELLDRHEKNVDSILKRRHNTLQAKPFCISEDKDRWHIGFLSATIDLNKLDSLQRTTNLSGRAVIVMKDSTEIRIAHKDPLFSSFKKL